MSYILLSSTPPPPLHYFIAPGGNWCFSNLTAPLVHKIERGLRAWDEARVGRNERLTLVWNAKTVNPKATICNDKSAR